MKILKKLLEKVLVNGLLACLILFGASHSYADQEAGASAREASTFIESIKDDLLKIIRNQNFSEQQKQTEIEKVFISIVDIDWLGKYALGRFGKTLSAEQKEKYKIAYRGYLINSYVPKFKKFNGQLMQVKKVTSSGPNQYEVKTEVIHNGDAPIEIKYDVIEKDYHKFYIYDLVTEGVSLAATQRTEFSNIITTKSFDYLLEKLTQKQQ